ncbi:MAG TPA: diacylglycerol kinase family protein [Longimicrobiales bacterium]
MRVTLLHNPAARGGQSPTGDALRGVIRAAGHDVVYLPTNGQHWRAALQDAGDLVVVAGGDGTVAAVFRELAATAPAGGAAPGLVTIIPVGTANNIARSLGLADAPEALVARWPELRPRPFDIGTAHGLDESRGFVEAVGVGALTEMIGALDGPAAGLNQAIREREGLPGYVALLRDMLARRRGVPLRVTLDGREREGTFLMAEVMNVGRVGPNLLLSAAADPSDGWLDVLLAGEAERSALEEYLEAQRRGSAEVPPLPTRPARRVELAPAEGRSLLVRRDDEVRRLHPGVPVKLHVHPGALRVLAA